MLDKVKMSAWIPAPPEGSVAAKVSTAGGALKESGMFKYLDMLQNSLCGARLS